MNKNMTDAAKVSRYLHEIMMIGLKFVKNNGETSAADLKHHLGLDIPCKPSTDVEQKGWVNGAIIKIMMNHGYVSYHKTRGRGYLNITKKGIRALGMRAL